MPKSKLLNDDCMQAMKQLDNSSVDLVLTDPPYNLGNFMKDRDTNLKKMRDNFFGSAGWDDLCFEEWEKSMDGFFKESSRVLKKGGAMIVLMSIIKVETLISIAERYKLYYKTTGIWHKPNPMPRNMNLHFINSTEAWVYFIYGKRTGTFNNSGKAIHDYIEVGVAANGERKQGKHPTQKPVALMEFFIRILSNEGELVLDPFMGSGSTGVAAIKNNRNFFGVEIDENYYQIAERRIKEVEKNEANRN
jgi:DNA modification methylase